MEKNNFFEWYKQKITEHPQDPPAEAWDNIADALDTNDVWDKVAARLDNTGGWFFQRPWNYALPALLLLLLSAGGYFLYIEATGDTRVAMVPAYAVTDSLARDVNGNQNEVIASDEKAAEASTRDGNGTSAGSKDITGKTQGHPQDQAASTQRKESLPQKNTTTAVDGTVVTDASPGEETFAAVDDDAVDARDADMNDNASADIDTVSDRNDESEDQEVPLIGDNGSSEPEPTTLPSQDNARAARVQIALDGRSSREGEVTTEADPFRQSGEVESSREEKEDNRIQPNGYTSFAVRRMVLPDSMLIVDPLALMIAPDSFHTAINPPSVVFSPSLEFGISGAVKNTWLLNQTTFAGLERHTLTTTLPDFGKNIGMAMRYNFARRFSAQVETFFISEIGQRYKEYRKGKYIERELDLNYFHGSLLLKYGNNAMMLDQLVNGHGIIGGLYFSKLKNATETIDGHTTGISDAYSSSDYGIILGYEYNQRLFSNFLFTSGVRLNYGLKNIRPASVSKTGTGSFDVNLGVRYRF